MAAESLMPDDFVDSVDEGGLVDLPFESSSADPQPLQYANVPGVKFDPKQNWRDAQSQAAQRLYGEFGQEATDG
jgi:hypothetical protein